MSTNPDPRQRVLLAAGRLYREHGMAGLSTEAIAREASTSKRTLYEHFSGRDAIVEALLLERLDRLEAELRAAAIQPGPIATRLRRIAGMTAMVPAEFPPSLWHDLRQLGPEVAERVRGRRKTVASGVLHDLLTSGVASGEVREDVPVPLLVAVAEVLAEHLIQREPPAGTSMLELAQTGIAVLLEGFLRQRQA